MAKPPYGILRRLSVKLQRPEVHGVGVNLGKRPQAMEIQPPRPRGKQLVSPGLGHSTDPNVSLENVNFPPEDPGIGNWSVDMQYPATVPGFASVGLIRMFMNPLVVDWSPDPPGQYASACAVPIWTCLHSQQCRTRSQRN